MKKLFTLANLIKICAVALGVVAFFMMFADQLYFEVGKTKTFVEYGEAFFGSKTNIIIGTIEAKGAIISFIGYLLVAVASLITLLSIFVNLDKGTQKIVAFCGALLLIAGAVMILVEANVYNAANEIESAKLAAAPIVAGILSALAACGLCASSFVKSK